MWSRGPKRGLVSFSNDISGRLRSHPWAVLRSPIGQRHSIITKRVSFSFALITNQTDKKYWVYENSFTSWMQHCGYSFHYSSTLLLHRLVFLWMSIFWVITVWCFRSVSNLTNLRFGLLLFLNDNRTMKTTQSKQDTIMNHCFRFGSPYATQRLGVRFNENVLRCANSVVGGQS